MPRQLSPHRQFHQGCVEPQPAAALHARVDVEIQRDAVGERATDLLVDGIFGADVELVYAFVHRQVRRAHLEHAIQHGARRGPGHARQQQHRQQQQGRQQRVMPPPAECVGLRRALHRSRPSL
jgi:hypothetical protein